MHTKNITRFTAINHMISSYFLSEESDKLRCYLLTHDNGKIVHWKTLIFHTVGLIYVGFVS